VHNLSGWFDEMYGATGAVENFEGAGDALILGPWVHGVGPVQQRKAGERDFGPRTASNRPGPRTTAPSVPPDRTLSPTR
jgi:predicted acyl esterase